MVVSVTPPAVSWPVSAVDDAINLLQQRKHSLRRSELTQALEGLGFSVRDGSKGGHKIVKHSALDGFFGTRFDSGHGADDEVKPCYVSSMIKVLKQYKDELEKVLGAQR